MFALYSATKSGLGQRVQSDLEFAKAATRAALFAAGDLKGYAMMAEGQHLGLLAQVAAEMYGPDGKFLSETALGEKTLGDLGFAGDGAFAGSFLRFFDPKQTASEFTQQMAIKSNSKIAQNIKEDIDYITSPASPFKMRVKSRTSKNIRLGDTFGLLRRITGSGESDIIKGNYEIQQGLTPIRFRSEMWKSSVGGPARDGRLGYGYTFINNYHVETYVSQILWEMAMSGQIKSGERFILELNYRPCPGGGRML